MIDIDIDNEECEPIMGSRGEATNEAEGQVSWSQHQERRL